MTYNVETILRSLYEAEPDVPPECRPCWAVLDAYIEAQLDGRDAGGLFPEVASHLPTCESCQIEHQELYSLLLADRNDELVMPANAPAQDFGYLQRLQPKPSFWRKTVEKAGNTVIEVIADIRIRIGDTVASFAELPAALSPQLSPAIATRGQGNREASVLPLPAPEEYDLLVSLELGLASQAETSVGARLTRRSSDEPLPRTRVTVRDASGNVLNSQRTDPNGTVAFPHFQGGRYVIEVHYGTNLFRLPLAFTLGDE